MSGPGCPAFRAVAETEHLPTAAKRLHLTPAALSRSVRLLEDALGRPLFHRVGRGIKLSTAGRHLADAVRGAMRLVDDGIEEVLDERLRGPLLVSAPLALHPVVLETARGLSAVHPEITLTLNSCASPEADLWAGRVDVALSPISHHKMPNCCGTWSSSSRPSCSHGAQHRRASSSTRRTAASQRRHLSVR